MPSTGILPNAGLPRGFFAANPQKESLDWQYRCFSRPSLNQSRGPPTYDRSEPRDAKYPIAFGAYIGFLLGALLDDVHKRYLKARLEQASKRLSYWESVLPDDDVLETMYHWSDDPAVTAADAVTPSYRPLLYKKDIRILVLLPARSRDDDIHVHIGHMSLESKAIEFEALSYTWGDPNPRDLIYVSGKPVYVRRNLANALRSLRSHTQLHLLWVDDLCIDVR